MLDWLKNDPRDLPAMTVGESELPIVIRRHARAKRMTLRLAPDGKDVRVTIPDWGRTIDALEFARSRRIWLERQLADLPTTSSIGAGEKFPYRGDILTIDYSAKAPRKPALDGDIIRLGGPETSLRSRLKRWLEAEARAYLTTDLAHYCQVVGKDTPRVALSNARRRWGSCAPDGSIRINWRLIMAPDVIRRSVVAHEAAHLVHFDHSPHFHALLGELFEDDIDTANRWLKSEGRRLYGPFG